MLSIFLTMSSLNGLTFHKCCFKCDPTDYSFKNNFCQKITKVRERAFSRSALTFTSSRFLLTLAHFIRKFKSLEPAHLAHSFSSISKTGLRIVNLQNQLRFVDLRNLQLEVHRSLDRWFNFKSQLWFVSLAHTLLLVLTLRWFQS